MSASTYTPCDGTGLGAHNVRRMNTAGLGSKFTHLHGKFTGQCPKCGKSVRTQDGNGVVPRHKDQRPDAVRWFGDVEAAR